MKLVYTFFVLTILFSLSYSQQFACDACKDSSCLQQNECRPKSACNNYQNIPITDDQKNEIVRKHNELRNQVASGAQNGQPSASNMRELVWDDELGNIAQCYANECVFQHFICDLSDNRGGFGQNIAGFSSSNKPDGVSYSSSVQLWYDEVSSFPSEYVDRYQFGNNYGHYSQVVWAKTQKVGCGAVLFEEGGWWKHQTYCNYYPPGNYIDAQVYERGSPASNCENGHSDNYSGLCK